MFQRVTTGIVFAAIALRLAVGFVATQSLPAQLSDAEFYAQIMAVTDCATGTYLREHAARVALQLDVNRGAQLRDAKID